MILSQSTLVDISSIIIGDDRQRADVKTEDLEPSLKRWGMLHPVVLTRDFHLIAGERRLTAAKRLGWSQVPARFFDELNLLEAITIELEENLKRKDLPWQDEVKAVKRIHDTYCQMEDDWDKVKTAESLGIEHTLVVKYIRVANDIDSPQIANAPGIAAAYNFLLRRDERAMGDAMSDILAAGAGAVSMQPENAQPQVPKGKFLPAEESILQTDFISWVKTYKGQPFNLIHCDFPYGINVFAGNYSGRHSSATYDDKPDVYWTLLDALCDNLDKIMSASGHLMFWFSMDYYNETLETFKTKAPGLEVQNFPLIWTKSDNVGIIPDAKRQPRRIYETCLIASREDRFLVKSVSNSYSAPTDKTYHPSTKPEPVLRQFMSMFVDPGTRLLDPTCGSGSALRAAESLGASHVLGLEKDPEHCDNARAALRKFRILRSSSK